MTATTTWSVCHTPLPRDAPGGLCPPCLLATFTGRTPNLAHPSGRALPPTIRCFGDYELLGEIASGGMGVVYFARQISLNRNVALKMIRSGALATPAEVQRFRTEAEAAANLDPPSIVPIYEVGEQEGQHYFSMKLVEGGNLAERISNFKCEISKREAARLIATLARAVHHAHQRGVLHRDLKPTNVLLDEQGAPHLTDFGLAKLAHDRGDLTQTIAILGTPHYMSPEQAAGRARELTTATDIYSLGAILYELLTGRPPFHGESALEVLPQAQARAPEPPRKLNPSVDRDLETICLMCLEKQPRRRYDTAATLAEDLDHWLAGEPIQARPVSPPERVLKWARRNPALASLIVVAHLLFLSGIIGVLWQWRRAEAEATRAQANGTRAETQEIVTREQLYASRITIAQRAWQDGDMPRLAETLNSLVPAAGQADLRGFEWHLLNRLAAQTSRAWHHGAQARAVAFSRDGQLLVTGGSDVRRARRIGRGPARWARPSGCNSSCGACRTDSGSAHSPETMAG